jgi:hypothetical protein
MISWSASSDSYELEAEQCHFVLNFSVLCTFVSLGLNRSDEGQLIC